MALETLTVLRNFRERSDFLPEVFLKLPDGITLPLHIERAPNNQEVRSTCDVLHFGQFYDSSERVPPPPLTYPIGHIIYLENMGIVAAPSRGMILTRGASKIGPSARKQMRMLPVEMALRDGCDVEMVGGTADDGVVEKYAPQSSAQVQDAYTVVVGAMEKVSATFHDWFDYVLDFYRNTTEFSLDGEFDLLHTDSHYNVRYFQNRSNADYDVLSNTGM